RAGWKRWVAQRKRPSIRMEGRANEKTTSRYVGAPVIKVRVLRLNFPVVSIQARKPEDQTAEQSFGARLNTNVRIGVTTAPPKVSIEPGETAVKKFEITDYTQNAPRSERVHGLNPTPTSATSPFLTSKHLSDSGRFICK